MSDAERVLREYHRDKMREFNKAWADWMNEPEWPSVTELRTAAFDRQLEPMRDQLRRIFNEVLADAVREYVTTPKWRLFKRTKALLAMMWAVRKLEAMK